MKTKDGYETIVIPSEGGHIDFPLIDDECVEYFNFFRKEAAKAENPFSYISLQRSFCGPSLPYMFRFYLSKHPEEQTNDPVPTS
jgi:glucokinase